MGWALLEQGPFYLDSGIWRFPRKNQDFQMYRLELEAQVTETVTAFLFETPVLQIVNEIVPSVGGGNFAVAGQSYLVNAATACIHSVAKTYNIPVEQIAANTVKVQIAGKAKATKVGVRNGVFEIFPELKSRKSDWVKEFDEPDAIAIGVAWMGHKI